MKRSAKPPTLSVPSQDGLGITAEGKYVQEDLEIGNHGMKVANETKMAYNSASDAKDGDFAENLDIKLKDLKVLTKLGEGASGCVHKAVHQPTGRFFATKEIPLEVSAQMRKQIEIELKTLYCASCPQIIRFYGAFFYEGAFSIVMEYMEIGSLHDVISSHKAKLSEGVIAGICTQILEGLRYLHKVQKVIHRDLKPSNLLLNARGQVKLSDFGMSGKMENSLDNKVSFVGTVTYMSPERINGEEYSFASDVWSFGLTVVEAATGRYPYPPPGCTAEVSSFWDMLDLIQNEEPPSLPEDGFSHQMCTFVQHCVAKAPDGRMAVVDLLEHDFIVQHQGSDELHQWVEGNYPSTSADCK